MGAEQRLCSQPAGATAARRVCCRRHGQDAAARGQGRSPGLALLDAAAGTCCLASFGLSYSPPPPSRPPAGRTTQRRRTSSTCPGARLVAALLPHTRSAVQGSRHSVACAEQRRPAARAPTHASTNTARARALPPAVPRRYGACIVYPVQGQADLPRFAAFEGEVASLARVAHMPTHLAAQRDGHRRAPACCKTRAPLSCCGVLCCGARRAPREPRRHVGAAGARAWATAFPCASLARPPGVGPASPCARLHPCACTARPPRSWCAGSTAPSRTGPGAAGATTSGCSCTTRAPAGRPPPSRTPSGSRTGAGEGTPRAWVAPACACAARPHDPPGSPSAPCGPGERSPPCPRGKALHACRRSTREHPLPPRERARAADRPPCVAPRCAGWT